MAPDDIAFQDVARSIQALCREFMEGVSAKDPARIAALYTDDARILMPSRPAIAGKSQILAFWQASLDGPVEQISLDISHIEVSGNLAYDLGSSTILLKTADEAPHEEKGKYVTVYRRQNPDDWKILVDSYSND